MSLEILTKNDLMIFKAELLGELKSLLTQQPTTAKKWLRSKEVLELLKISPGTLQNYRLKGIIKFTKIGNTLYYAFDDIVKMLDNQKAD